MTMSGSWVGGMRSVSFLGCRDIVIRELMLVGGGWFDVGEAPE